MLPFNSQVPFANRSPVYRHRRVITAYAAEYQRNSRQTVRPVSTNNSQKEENTGSDKFT
jgi:hypothetical protein